MRHISFVRILEYNFRPSNLIHRAILMPPSNSQKEKEALQATGAGRDVSEQAAGARGPRRAVRARDAPRATARERANSAARDQSSCTTCHMWPRTGLASGWSSGQGHVPHSAAAIARVQKKRKVQPPTLPSLKLLDEATMHEARIVANAPCASVSCIAVPTWQCLFTHRE